MSDFFIKVKPEERDICETIEKNVIGVTGDTTLRVTSVTTDANCIFIDGLNGDDGNAGTQASPKQTISGAFTAIIATGITNQNYIQIEDDTYPYEIETERIPARSGGSTLHIQAGNGVTPQLYLQNYATDAVVTITQSGSSFIYPGYPVMGCIGTSMYFAEYDGTQWEFEKFDGTTKSTEYNWATYNFSTLWEGVRSVYRPNSGGTYDLTYYNSILAIANKTDKLGIYKLPIINSVGDFFDDTPYGSSGNANNRYDTITDSNIIPNDETTAEGAFKVCPGYGGLDIISGNVQESFLFLQQGSVNIYTGIALRELIYGWSIKISLDLRIFTVKLNLPNTYDLEHFYNKVYIAHDGGIKSLAVDTPESINRGKELSGYIDEPIIAENVRSLKAFYFNRGIPLDGRDRLYAGCENGDIFEYNPTSQEWKLLINIGVSITEIKAVEVFGLHKIMYVLNGDNLYRIDLNTLESDLQIEDACKHITYWNYGLDNSLQGFYFSNNNYIYKKYEDMVLPDTIEFNGIKFEPYLREHSGFRQCVVSSFVSHFDWCDINTKTGKIYSLSPTLTYYTFIQNCNINNSQYGMVFLTSTDWETTNNPKCRLRLFNNNIWNIEEYGILGHYYGYYLSGQDFGIRKNNFFNIRNAIVFSNTSVPLYVCGNNFLQIAEYNVRALSEPAELKNNVSYLSNLGFSNCNESLYYPTIYQHPLFKNLTENNEDFKLLSEWEGALFDSPSIRTPYTYSGVTYNDVPYVNNENWTNNTEKDEIDISGYDLYEIMYEFSSITPNPSTPTLYFEGSNDGSSWTTIISFSLTIFTSGTIFGFNSFYKYFRVRNNDSTIDNLYITLYFRDIGAHDIERTLIDSTLAEIEIEKDPVTMTISRFKANSESSYNFDGFPALLSRSKQITKWRFDWDSKSIEIFEDIYKILTIYALNKNKLRIYFDHMTRNTANCTLSSDCPLNTGNQLVRVYLDNCGYNINYIYLKITQSDFDWKINEWLGWYVTISGEGDYNNTYKVIYNDETTIWLDYNVDADISDLSKTFLIEYIRAIISSTDNEFSQKFIEVEAASEDQDPRISTIEFLEA